MKLEDQSKIDAIQKAIDREDERLKKVTEQKIAVIKKGENKTLSHDAKGLGADKIAGDKHDDFEDEMKNFSSFFNGKFDPKKKYKNKKTGNIIAIDGYTDGIVYVRGISSTVEGRKKVKHVPGEDFEKFMEDYEEEGVKKKKEKITKEIFEERYISLSGKAFFVSDKKEGKWIFISKNFDDKKGVEVSMGNDSSKRKQKRKVSKRILVKDVEKMEKLLSEYRYQEGSASQNDKESDVEEIEKDLIEDLGGKKFEEKEAQERAKKIEELKQAVEKRRKEYLEADYKRKGAFKRLGNFFGKVFKEKEEKNLENDQEIAWYRAYYDDALMNYKNALLEDAKSRGASDKELLDIAKTFQLEANINIADVNHQVKIENQEGRFSGFIKEHSMDLVQRYKKLSLAKKIAIGAAFGGAALGAGYLGAAAVGAVGSAVAVRRAFLALVTGTTTSLTLEAMGKKKTEENIEKGMSSLEEKMMRLTEEEKFNLINEIIGNDIKDEDNNINKIKNKNLRHLAYGVAAGAATMLLPKITRAFSEKTGAGEWAKEHIFGKTIQQEVPGAGKTVPEAIADAEKPEAGQVPENNIPEKTIEKAETVLEVQKGSSLEGSIIQHIKGHPEFIEKYNELNGGRSFNAGQIAHRMALDYADKYPESFPQGPPSLVHEGTEIKINPETMEIEDIQSEEKLGYLPENDTDSKIRPEEMKTPSFEENQQEILNKELSEMDASDREKIMRNFQRELEENERETSAMEDQPASKYNTNEPWKYDEDLEKLKEKNREIWSNIFKEDSIPNILSKARKEICMGNIGNWRQVKDLAIDNPNAFSSVDEEIKKGISGFYAQSYNLIGDSAKPKSGESIAKWTERVVKLIVRRK